MKIAPATADDLSEVKRLLSECSLPSSDIAASHLKHFFVSKDGGELVGVTGLQIDGKYALLRSVAVRETHRDKGIASHLVSVAEKHARDNSVEVLYLLTAIAVDFFAKLGYSKTERESAPDAMQRTSEFSSLCAQRAVCMTKRL
jgi:amino-acid N-acetyltransferase